jgi:hypothetical protein
MTSLSSSLKKDTTGSDVVIFHLGIANDIIGKRSILIVPIADIVQIGADIAQPTMYQKALASAQTDPDLPFHGRTFEINQKPQVCRPLDPVKVDILPRRIVALARVDNGVIWAFIAQLTVRFGGELGGDASGTETEIMFGVVGVREGNKRRRGGGG